MTATWVTFLFEAANFLLLAALLGWLFFRPVRHALERRREELERAERAAADARTEAEAALQKARARGAELERSASDLREQVRREAEEERERILAAARAQSQREHDTLKEQLVALRRGQARSLTRDAAFAAREIVVRLLEMMGGPDLEETLLQAACRELENLRLSGPPLPVVIESARPLGEAALASLAEAAGMPVGHATHRVDPDLVAGVRVLTAKGLVDVSAAGLAAQAERVLLRRLDSEEADHD